MGAPSGDKCHSDTLQKLVQRERPVRCAAVLDACSCRAVSWFLDAAPTAALVTNAPGIPSTRGDVAASLLLSRATVNIESLLAEVRVPTLVLHARDDQVAPVSEGRLLASSIPGAEFIELDSRNHVLLEHEPAWGHFQNAVLEFTGQKVSPAEDPFGALSPRERETLALLATGLSNAEIAERLGISEKTVRNHLSHLFDKLGVWSRAQAIVFARERGFVP